MGTDHVDKSGKVIVTQRRSPTRQVPHMALTESSVIMIKYEVVGAREVLVGEQFWDYRRHVTGRRSAHPITLPLREKVAR